MWSGNYDADDTRDRHRQSGSRRSPHDRRDDEDWRMQEPQREREWDSEQRGRGSEYRGNVGRGDDRWQAWDDRQRGTNGPDMGARERSRGDAMRDESERGRYGGNTPRHRPDESRTSGTYGRDEWSQGASGRRGGSWGHHDMEPEDAQWTQRQGLYGSTEYGGWLGGGQYRQGTSPDEGRGSSRARVQGHAGKGPKGWQRSDERIRDDVCEALARHPGIDASDIEVQVSGGEITLSGGIADRAGKRLAEDIVESVFGVSEVQNQLRVKREREEGMESSSGRGKDREVGRSTEREASGGSRGRPGTATNG